MKTSLIITTYNWKEALTLTLVSALKQTVAADEIIIADDGSKPDTKAQIERIQKTFNQHPTPIIHCWHEDDGFRASAIRNLAIKQAQHEYLIFVDGDMILPASFIEDHKRFAKAHQLIQGTRVLIGDKITQKLLKTELDVLSEQAVGYFKLSPLSSGIKNRKNTIRQLLLSRYFSKQDQALNGTRTCNISFFKEDAMLVNGFNEDFKRWGLEDSEFVARMIHAGCSRLYLRFAANAYHLNHPVRKESVHFPENVALFEATITEKKTRCERGLSTD